MFHNQLFTIGLLVYDLFWMWTTWMLDAEGQNMSEHVRTVKVKGLLEKNAKDLLLVSEWCASICWHAGHSLSK